MKAPESEFFEEQAAPDEGIHLENLDVEVGGVDLPSKRTDPFTKRTGKTLLWLDMNMTLAANKDQPERKLLDSVWGEVPPNNTTAIMGPSGAG